MSRGERATGAGTPDPGCAEGLIHRLLAGLVALLVVAAPSRAPAAPAQSARPALPVSEGSPTYYGLGWNVRQVTNGLNLWHLGSLSGTRAMVMIRANGAIFVATFNSRPPREKENEIGSNIDRALNGATNAVNAANRWPDHDLFDQYP